jgi:tripartite ATP-independent transporter DctP family solute receptor
MNMRKILALSLAVALCLLTAACGGGTAPASSAAAPAASGEAPAASGETYVLRLGHMGNETNPLNTYTMRFKERVEERSNGAITIDVYGDKVLGTDRELLEQVQSGTLDMTVTTTSVLQNFIPAYATLDLPYLLKGWDHCYKFFDSDVYTRLLAEGADSGITCLSLAGRGFRHVTTNDRPIRTPDDIKGLKLRVIESSVYNDTFTAFGANPQAMSFGEVITALQQGTIEGHENSYAVIEQEHVYEVQNTVSETAHMFAFFDMCINTDLLNSMPAEYQEIIRTAALEAGLEETQAEQADEGACKERLKGFGMTLIEDVDVPAFAALVQPVYDKFGQTNDLTYLHDIQALA